MRALNLGCGLRFHPDWENVDFVPAHASVKACDLRAGVPYPEGSFDVVYHSHVLEHFSKKAAPHFLGECFRVLKPGGVLRVAVPDLEGIARCYLRALENAAQDITGSDSNHEWMVLEMYDQTVRDVSGGECAAYFQRKPFPNWEFVALRVGSYADLLRQAVQNGPSSPGNRNIGEPPRNWSYIARNPGKVIRNKLLRGLLGAEDWECLQIGRFRNGGEIHKWMYDSHSLACLLRAVGFTGPKRRTASESGIPDRPSFRLDCEADGKPYKADSLYMEAIKP